MPRPRRAAPMASASASVRAWLAESLAALKISPVFSTLAVVRPSISSFTFLTRAAPAGSPLKPVFMMFSAFLEGGLGLLRQLVGILGRVGQDHVAELEVGDADTEFGVVEHDEAFH